MLGAKGRGAAPNLSGQPGLRPGQHCARRKHMIASLQEREKRLKSEVSQLHEQGKLDHLVDA